MCKLQSAVYGTLVACFVGYSQALFCIVKFYNIHVFLGSFKIRGASYQFSKIKKNKDLVTMSAGNYGTAFAFLARELKIAHKAIVYMPANINMARQERIKVSTDFQL